MTPPAARPNNNDVLVAKLDGMSCDMAEIKAAVKEQTESFRTFQVTYTKEHEIVVQTAKRAHERLDELAKSEAKQDQEIQALQDAIGPLIVMSKTLTWLAIALGGSIIGLIWMIIIGQVQLVFP
jgi:excinuclease UvrABC helicase subunit UvrB